MPNWLKCSVMKGMFNDERTVTVTAASGDRVAVFVPYDQVNEQLGQVKVFTVMDSGAPVAILPDADRSVIRIRAADLSSI